MEIYSKAIGSIIALLLLSPTNAGLDFRPSNLTCLAETLTPRITITNAFPGTVFLRPMVMKQHQADSSRIFVAEKGGTIQLMVNGKKQTTPFLDISSNVSTGGEQGLLGLAFHPNYSSNRFFYISYTDLNNNSVISRFTRSANNQNVADPNSESLILTLDQPYANHNGGNIDFGPDGYLYIGFGDGGSGGDPLDHGQDLSTWLGTMLRIDVDGGQPYAIPPGNPFSDQSCFQLNRTGICPEIYAFGLRNPWRWSFDRATEELWLGDVGQNLIEEIDIIESGANLGWRCFEGTEPYNQAGCDSIVATPPVTQYSHTYGRCSVTGGYVYRGSVIPEFDGYYLYGDYCTGEIWGLSTKDMPVAAPFLLTQSAANVSSFAEDNDGEIYILQSNGQIGKFELDLEGGGPDPVSDLLSKTGCVDSSDPTQPASGMIPYDINAPFWSDGAKKSRWLALPNDRQIYNTNEDWYFPPGTVLIKQFEIGGKLIETRHLKRHTNGSWAGYTYEWNDTETDAIRVNGGKIVVVANGSTTQDWVFPSEAECFACHTSAAGFALGPEPPQLNKDYYYASTGRTDNQLNTASKIGLLVNDLDAQPESLPRLSNPYIDEGSLVQRARAWLHANCSGCHLPGGSTNSAMDLRVSTIFSETNSCNIPANSVEIGWPPLLLSPGDSSASLIYFRANSRDPITQMPPVGSNLIDTTGMEVLENWINGLINCTP